MAPNRLSKPKMWLITTISKQNLSDEDRDMVAELISEEARKTIKSYSFVLHNIIESKRYCKILVEGTKIALGNLLSVLEDNLPYEITYIRCGKRGG
jgi:hypothetical protein